MISAARTQKPDHMGQFKTVIGRAAGIILDDSKNEMIEGRLQKRVVALGRRDVQDYLHFLFEENGLARELPDLIDLMSTNRTDFFRENSHFQFLTDKILPKHDPKKMFKFWSAASSSGEEAYTTAMLLSEHAEKTRGFAFGILGTDISRNILNKAQAGVYTSDDMAPVPAHLQEKYIRQQGKNEFAVADELKRKTRFARLNLVEGNYPIDRDLDVIFLRNVLIYFSPQTRRRVVAEVVSHLKVGGYFFVGHSESMAVRHPNLQNCASAVFQKVRDE